MIALGTIHERAPWQQLWRCSRKLRPEVRYHAVNAVAKFKDPKTLKAVAALLEDSDPMVRNGAAKVIEEFGQAVEDKGVKEILRRVRSRDLLGRLIPKWVYFVLPQSKAARGTVAAVLAASLLLGFIIKTTIGGPNKVLVRQCAVPGGSSARRRHVGRRADSGDARSLGRQRATCQPAGRIGKPANSAVPRKGGVVLMSGESVVPWKLSGNPDLAAGWKEHKQPILNACVTPDGKFAATLGKDLIAVVWDLEAGKKRATVELDERFAATLTISPDGQRLATSNRKGEVVLWEVESGRRAKELSGAKIPKAISALAISPDGNWLVGVEVSGGLRVWDLTAPAGSPVEKSFASRTPLRGCVAVSQRLEANRDGRCGWRGASLGHRQWRVAHSLHGRHRPDRRVCPERRRKAIRDRRKRQQCCARLRPGIGRTLQKAGRETIVTRWETRSRRTFHESWIGGILCSRPSGAACFGRP